jgi:hypothetical protein
MSLPLRSGTTGPFFDAPAGQFLRSDGPGLGWSPAPAPGSALFDLQFGDGDVFTGPGSVFLGATAGAAFIPGTSFTYLAPAPLIYRKIGARHFPGVGAGFAEYQLFVDGAPVGLLVPSPVTSGLYVSAPQAPILIPEGARLQMLLSIVAPADTIGIALAFATFERT